MQLMNPLLSVVACVCLFCVCFARATMSDRKAVIKNADMSEDMQQDAVECATQALEKYNIEKDIAAFIKKVKGAKNPTFPSTQGRWSRDQAIGRA